MVPVLVNTGGHNMVGIMIYSLIISGAALLLLRYVFRYWLWGGVLAGALGWWLVSLTAVEAEAFRGIYLALLAWGMLAIPALDWLLRSSDTDTVAGARPVRVFGQHLQLNQLACYW